MSTQHTTLLRKTRREPSKETDNEHYSEEKAGSLASTLRLETPTGATGVEVWLIARRVGGCARWGHEHSFHRRVGGLA